MHSPLRIQIWSCPNAVSASYHMTPLYSEVTEVTKCLMCTQQIFLSFISFINGCLLCHVPLLVTPVPIIMMLHVYIGIGVIVTLVGSQSLQLATRFESQLAVRAEFYGGYALVTPTCPSGAKECSSGLCCPADKSCIVSARYVVCCPDGKACSAAVL